MMFGGMWLFWILILVVLGVVVAWLVRAGSLARPTVSPPRPSAEEILKERYARGEIDRDEFQSRLRDLRA